MASNNQSRSFRGRNGGNNTPRTYYQNKRYRNEDYDQEKGNEVGDQSASHHHHHKQRNYNSNIRGNPHKNYNNNNNNNNNSRLKGDGNQGQGGWYNRRIRQTDDYFYNGNFRSRSYSGGLENNCYQSSPESQLQLRQYPSQTFYENMMQQQYERDVYEKYCFQSGVNLSLQYDKDGMLMRPGFFPIRGGPHFLAQMKNLSQEEDWTWHEKTYGSNVRPPIDFGHGDIGVESSDGILDIHKFGHMLPLGLSDMLLNCIKPLMQESNALNPNPKPSPPGTNMGVDDFDSLSVTDSGVFSDNDGCSSGRASPVSCKAEGLGVESRDRFAILTYEQVKRVDSVLNEMVALEGRGNFPALELKLIDLLTAVKDRLVQEGIKIRDIRLNGGAASYALKDRLDFCCVCGVVYQPSGSEDGGMLCSCLSIEGQTNQKNFSYNDIDLIFGMELSTVKHFDRVKTAVLDALLDLLPPQVSRKRMSPCALKEAYVSKMVKVCEGDRWSLIALGNGPAVNSSSKGRSCSVELKFVDTMRRQYEFSVDSFQIVLDSLMLFYKCATVPMSSRFYPTVVGESVFGDFYGALYHLQQGLIATRHPEEIRGGGLLKYCNLLVRGCRPADVHSIPPLQRYMCSRFFIDFPEVEQQESKLRTYLANHMSGVSARLRYAFLITLYHVVDSSTVCLMGHERRLTLQLIQRLACELFSTDCGGQGIYGPQPNYQCYSTYYMPQCTLTSNSSCSSDSSPAPHPNGTTYYPAPPIAASVSSPAVLSTTSVPQQNYQSQRPISNLQKSCSNSSKTPRHSQPQTSQNSSKSSSTPTTVPLVAAS